jgi:hypothetical protein
MRATHLKGEYLVPIFLQRRFRGVFEQLEDAVMVLS